MVNNHYKQLAQPSKLFNFVRKMKHYSNPFFSGIGDFYKDEGDFDEYRKEFKEECKKTDRRGYKVVVEIFIWYLEENPFEDDEQQINLMYYISKTKILFFINIFSTQFQ